MESDSAYAVYCREVEVLREIFGSTMTEESDLKFRVGLPQNCKLQFTLPLPGSMELAEVSVIGGDVTEKTSLNAAQTAARNVLLERRGEDGQLYEAFMAASEIMSVDSERVGDETPADCVFTERGNDADAHAVAKESSAECLDTVVIALDHMRDRRMYMKILKSWVEDLRIAGTISRREELDSKGLTKDVYIVLQGRTKSLDEFLRRLRTENVDVNSKGQACKERMSSVLARFSDSQNDGHGRDRDDGSVVSKTKGTAADSYTRTGSQLTKNKLTEIVFPNNVMENTVAYVRSELADSFLADQLEAIDVSQFQPRFRGKRNKSSK
jgi:hypothetical protein